MAHLPAVPVCGADLPAAGVYHPPALHGKPDRLPAAGAGDLGRGHHDRGPRPCHPACFRRCSAGYPLRRDQCGISVLCPV